MATVVSDREMRELAEQVDSIRASVRAVRRDLKEVRRLVENLVKERDDG